MSANLYDILDVDEHASVEEIRAAWKAAVADLDPTDRRFRAFNDAAAVLLDQDKRAAYDAELVATRAVDDTTTGAAAAHADEVDAPAHDAGTSGAGEEPAAPVTLTEDTGDTGDIGDTEDAGDTGDTGDTGGTEDAGDTTGATGDVTAPAPIEQPAKPSAAPRPQKPSAGPPGWALGAAGVAALAALALAIILLVQPGGHLFADDSPQDVAAANASFEKASLSVEGAAERMIADVFSYNYKTMDADLERAQQYVTPELGAKQAKGWPDIARDAADQKLVVQARAEAVALTRLSADRKDATVVVFLVQDSTRNGVDQTPLRMWVSLKMVRADGSADSWLIDDVCVDSNCDQPGS